MPDRLHVSAKHRGVLEAVLREHLPDVEVWAYGSRVNGLGHDGSDLDLVLRGPGLEKIPIERLMDFEEAVRESTIPFLVEARDWARLPERFHREIERGYVVVVGSESFSGHDVEWRWSTWGDEITLESTTGRRFRPRQGPQSIRANSPSRPSPSNAPSPTSSARWTTRSN